MCFACNICLRGFQLRLKDGSLILLHLMSLFLVSLVKKKKKVVNIYVLCFVFFFVFFFRKFTVGVTFNVMCIWNFVLFSPILVST